MSSGGKINPQLRIPLDRALWTLPMVRILRGRLSILFFVKQGIIFHNSGPKAYILKDHSVYSLKINFGAAREMWGVQLSRQGMRAAPAKF